MGTIAGSQDGSIVFMTRRQSDPFTQSELVDDALASATENPLSEREMEVARLLATGLSNVEIARQLVISPHTVKVHLRNIFEKLQVNSRTEASMVLLQHGWLTVQGVEVSPLPEAPPPLAPAPLADLPGQVLPWQRLYLLAVLLFCLVVLIAPNLQARGPFSPELLSDAGRTVLGKPAPQLSARWQGGTPLNLARSRMAAARIGDQLYVLGGEAAGGQILNTVQSYDLRVNEWHSAPPLPEPLSNLAAAALEDRIYVAGGSNNQGVEPGRATVRDGFWVYDLEQQVWEPLGALPMPLAGAQLVAHSDSLYLLGGWDGEQMHDKVWRYSPGTEIATQRPNWTLVARLDPPRAFFGATVVGDEIYVVGGYDGEQELTQAAVYAIATGEWRALPPLFTPRSGLSLVYDGQAVFALGGGWTQPLNTHERFDPVVGVWSNFPSPLQGEWRHLAAASYDDRIHLIGGWSGDYLDFHLRYQSTFRALLPLISND